MFISLGFLVATSDEKLPEVKRIAKEHGLSTTVIGYTDTSKAVKLKLGEEELVFFDFTEGGVFTPKNMNE
jgi:selenophosphate synthetase-related protein